MKFLNKTNWIWSGITDRSPDIYRLFRRDFDFVPGTERVLLEIAVCSTFELKINGKTVCGQQLSDFPDTPTGSVFDVTEMLVAGKNQLLVQVHYIGDDFLTGLAGKPFVKIALYRGDELLLSGDDSWEYCVDERFHSGLLCKVTGQLGFAFEYSANWLPEESDWKKAAVVSDDFAGITVQKRTVPQLNELPSPEAVVVQTGVFKRMQNSGTFADSCMTDAMIPVPFFDFYDGTDQAFFHPSRAPELQDFSRRQCAA